MKRKEKKEKKEIKIQIKKKAFIGVYDYTVILTYLSLVSAVAGIILALEGEPTLAVLCVAFSGFCDAFDGAVARTKKNRTDDERNFGIQLDSICDVISFGVTPAVICYTLGVDGVIGFLFCAAYVLCALIRLAFFNVLEIKRQQVEDGAGKGYRGLPVTSICFIFPAVYFCRYLLNWIFAPHGNMIFVVLLHVMLAVVAFLFILDFKMKKINFDKLLGGKKSKKNSDKNS